MAAVRQAVVIFAPEMSIVDDGFSGHRKCILLVRRM
jgi:hypothetical protein